MLTKFKYPDSLFSEFCNFAEQFFNLNYFLASFGWSAVDIQISTKMYINQTT